MGLFDFLGNIGHSASNFENVNLKKDNEAILKRLETLAIRGLVPKEFKEELCDAYFSGKIDKECLNRNISKSIKIHEEIELKVIGIDEAMFSKKDNSKEYIGAIDRLPEDNSASHKDRGTISYNLTKEIFQHLEGRILNIKTLNKLCDALDCDIKSTFKFKVLPKDVTIRENKS